MNSVVYHSVSCLFLSELSRSEKKNIYIPFESDIHIALPFDLFDSDSIPSSTQQLIPILTFQALGVHLTVCQLARYTGQPRFHTIGSTSFMQISLCPLFHFKHSHTHIRVSTPISCTLYGGDENILQLQPSLFWFHFFFCFLRTRVLSYSPLPAVPPTRYRETGALSGPDLGRIFIRMRRTSTSSRSIVESSLKIGAKGREKAVRGKFVRYRWVSLVLPP